MPLTILMITNNYTPYSGGVVSSIQTSAQELRSQGHRVIIATLSFTDNDPQEPDVIRIPSHLYFTYKQNPCGIPNNAAATIENIIKEYSPDIIHSHHPFLLGVLAARLSKKYNISLIFTHHTQYEQYAHYIPLPKPFTQSLINKRVKEYCARTQIVIAPSASLASQLPTNHTIIPSCIRTHFIHTTQPKKQGDITELITVSRFTPEKNIPFLLKAYSLLPRNRYKFTLFGFGYELEKLQALAYNSYNLNPEYCVFMAHPTQEQLIKAYMHAHLFIFASQTETQGLVIAEALAAGTPVIAVNAPGVCEAITHGSNGFLVHTEQELAQNIERATTDPLLYQRLSANAWHSAKRYYPETHGTLLIQTYNDVIRKFLNCQGSS